MLPSFAHLPYLLYTDQTSLAQLEKYPHIQPIFQSSKRITTRLPESTARVQVIEAFYKVFSK